MDSPCIKQTVCKVLNIFQYGKYLVAYVLNISKYRAILVQLIAMEIIEGSKIVLHRVLQN